MVPQGPGGKEGTKDMHQHRNRLGDGGAAVRRELMMERPAPGLRWGDADGMPVLKKDRGGRGKTQLGGVMKEGASRGWEGLKLPPLRSRAGGDSEQKTPQGSTHCDLSPQPMALMPLGASPPRKLEARTFRVSPIVPPPGHSHPSARVNMPSPPKEKRETAASAARPHMHRTPPRPQPASLHIAPASSPGHEEGHGPAERSPLQDATGGPGTPSDASQDYTPSCVDVNKLVALLRNRGGSEESVKAWREQFDGMVQASVSKEPAYQTTDGSHVSGKAPQQSDELGAQRPHQPSSPPQREAAGGQAISSEGSQGFRGMHCELDRLESPPLIGCAAGLNDEVGDVDIDEDTMMSLVYDPDLECYYDPNTQRYFKLKFNGPFDGIKTIHRLGGDEDSGPR
uniref:Uncharacterized protein n=2 Tax=Hemiselmis andersenii TaxID=464988 RepID=A0A7S0UE14_HEMAN|mmetsp:Transcript_9627/g.22368  ORF Transcript_9627/g.22368 Transcript_9627/m.22368 type:complete len:397 (+) Transcript_9627:209-1399(+)